MMGGNKEKFHYYMGDQPPSTSTSLPPRPSPTATTKTKKTKEKMCIETDDSESVLSPLEGLMDISSSSDDEQLEVPSRLTIQRKQQPAVVTAAVVVERKQGKIEGVLKKKEPDIRKKEKRREWVFEDSLSQPTTVTLKKRKMHGKNNLFKSHSQPTTTATAVTTAATASRFELDLSDDDAFNVKSTASSSTTTKTTHKLSKKSFTKCNNINSDSDDILQGPLPWLNAAKKSTTLTTTTISSSKSSGTAAALKRQPPLSPLLDHELRAAVSEAKGLRGTASKRSYLESSSSSNDGNNSDHDVDDFSNEKPTNSKGTKKSSSTPKRSASSSPTNTTTTTIKQPKKLLSGEAVAFTEMFKQAPLSETTKKKKESGSTKNSNSNTTSSKSKSAKGASSSGTKSKNVVSSSQSSSSKSTTATTSTKKRQKTSSSKTTTTVQRTIALEDLVKSSQSVFSNFQECDYSVVSSADERVGDDDNDLDNYSDDKDDDMFGSGRIVDEQEDIDRVLASLPDDFDGHQCPKCRRPIPDVYWTTTRKSIFHQASIRNPNGSLKHVKQASEFCTAHSTWNKFYSMRSNSNSPCSNYPITMDTRALRKRVVEMREVLDGIITGQVQSTFKDFCLDVFKTLGSSRAKSNHCKIDRFLESQCGYYGLKGTDTIHKALEKMYGQEHRIGSKLNKAACKPLTPIEYIAEILTPEVGSRLIQQDYSAHQGSSSSDGGGISLEKARTIMKESWDYGRIMFDEYSDHEEEEWENNKCISD